MHLDQTHTQQQGRWRIPAAWYLWRSDRQTTTSGDRKIGGLLQSANQRPMKMSELLTSKLSQVISFLDVI